MLLLLDTLHQEVKLEGQLQRNISETRPGLVVPGMTQALWPGVIKFSSALLTILCGYIVFFFPMEPNVILFITMVESRQITKGLVIWGH